MLNEGIKLKEWVENALKKDSSHMQAGMPTNDEMKTKMQEEFENVHTKLVEIFLRWQPGVDDLGLASTVYKTVHKYVLFILGVEYVDAGNQNIENDDQLKEIDKIIGEILRKNPFAKYGSDLICNLNINQRASIPLQELRAIYFDEKYGEDEVYCSNCPWHTRPSFNNKNKVKKARREVYANRKQEDEMKREAVLEGKKIVSLLRCYDCHTHRWNTNHVENKYKQFETMTRTAIAESLGPEYFLSVNTLSDKWQLGCFDLYYPGETKIFSKNEAKVWPAIGNMITAIKNADIKIAQDAEKASKNEGEKKPVLDE